MTGKDSKRKEAIRYIENQIRDGYIDLNSLDEVEMDIITCALKQYGQQKWISCSERLPDVYEAVLTTAKDDRVRENFRINDDEWSYGNFRTVIAWMPLPKPYQEDNQ